jgi:F0F1-type ATP synthase membrane subunit b/b'
MGAIFLQLFLMVNMFLLGVVVVIAYQHYRDNIKPGKPEPEHEHPHTPGTLPERMRDEMIEAATANFQSVLMKSATDLQHDLKSTTTEVNKYLESVATKMVDEEMQHYNKLIEELRNQTQSTLSHAQKDVMAHDDELKARIAENEAAAKATLEREIGYEKQRLIKEIDTKLADAITSFLTETLGHNVDLGAQQAYLLKQLDEHKDELKRELGDEQH